MGDSAPRCHQKPRVDSAGREGEGEREERDPKGVKTNTYVSSGSGRRQCASAGLEAGSGWSCSRVSQFLAGCHWLRTSCRRRRGNITPLPGWAGPRRCFSCVHPCHFLAARLEGGGKDLKLRLIQREVQQWRCWPGTRTCGYDPNCLPRLFPLPASKCGEAVAAGKNARYASCREHCHVPTLA